MAVLSPVVAWCTGKKRYGCSDCRWRGWKQPLLRRGHAKPRPIARSDRRVSPTTSMLVIVTSVLGILIVSLQAGCNPSRNSNTGAPRGSVEVVKNPLW